MNTASQEPSRPYEKPELTVIDYAAEEVMAVGCKVAGGGASKKPGAGCAISSCFSVGS